MIGQLVVGRFNGPNPSPAFLSRVRSGELGSVVLFGDNTAGSVDATRLVIATLQRAARDGGNPPLLIMTDQEGGEVRRLPGPPYLSPADMASDDAARLEGEATGRLLRFVGVNVDLAPVADVIEVAGSFLGNRAFGSVPTQVADRACAFASGLARMGIVYTLKHFPGLGRATSSTDTSPVSIPAMASDLRGGYAAYEKCGAGADALIMISSASYPRLTGPLPAVISPLLYEHELPIALRRPRALTISDDLGTPALAAQSDVARKAIAAGLNLVTYVHDERGSARAYAMLVDDARFGRLRLDRVLASARAIEALKRAVAH